MQKNCINKLYSFTAKITTGEIMLWQNDTGQLAEFAFTLTGTVIVKTRN